MVAQVNVAQVKVAEEGRGLPPGERAFEIYRRIEVDGMSTRAVAQQIGLSQTRVVQLRDSVENWVARQPSATGGLTKQQRLQAAEYKAGLRLDHLCSLALEAFRQSQGSEVSSEEALGGGRLVKTRITQGNTRYLQMAMRIAAQQSRIPVTPIAAEPEFEDELPTEAVAEATSPPLEDCSPEAREQEQLSETAEQPVVVNAAVAGTSKLATQTQADASERFAADFFPVQTDVRVEEHPLDEPTLTRKQRRRRARMLAELRKA